MIDMRGNQGNRQFIVFCGSDHDEENGLGIKAASQLALRANGGCSSE